MTGGFVRAVVRRTTWPTFAIVALFAVAQLSCLLHAAGQTPRTAPAEKDAARSPGQDAGKAGRVPNRTDETLSSVLSPEEWNRVDAAVQRGLVWLASQQQDDGSFATTERGQPGVTCLCLLAFMAHGHLPGEGAYGPKLERAVKYVVSCQRENGLFALLGPDGPKIQRNVSFEIGVAAAYNHGISALTLSEIYGTRGFQRARPLQAPIERALTASLEMQRWPKPRPVDQGGWRYVVRNEPADSDMSITGWELMFLRSARNAGFEVPKESIDDAIAYIRRNFDPNQGAFGYTTGQDPVPSRGTAGAGILALAHAGFHNSEEAQRSGQWILKYSFEPYNQTGYPVYRERYHYSLLTCCQAMYQLGGRMWAEFYPRTVKTLLANQQPDGSWPPEGMQSDSVFGSCYTTSLVVISLGAPNQLLPVFQR